MTEKMTYINRKGQAYFFRTVSGRRGTQIVCSQKKTADDLAAIPDTHEIVELPKGQVSCHKKIKYDLLPEEIALAKELCPKLVKPKVLTFVEVKKKALIIHSKETSKLDRIVERLPVRSGVDLSVLADNIPFEPMMKLELYDKKFRTFMVYRMCFMGETEWMPLDDGPLETLLRDYVYHIGQENFYELF